MDSNVTLSNLHSQHGNLLSCSLSPDDAVLTTGGADGTIRITQWGAAYNNNIKSMSAATTDNEK